MGGAEVETDTRIAGYEDLRRMNFRVILDRLASVRSLEGARVLDVGSAYGWFLEEATRAGAVAVGIEPDKRVAARSAGEVRTDRFPDALLPEEQFDVITFNDVLEHIPDVRGALAACHRHLRPGGLLSVNIPVADGLAFRVARVLTCVNVNGPYLRLWQYDLASPHLHYFTRSALVELIDSCDMRVCAVRGLPAMMRKGLWQRVHTIRRPSPASIVSFTSLYVAAGILNSPQLGDIVHVIAVRHGDDR